MGFNVTIALYTISLFGRNDNRHFATRFHELDHHGKASKLWNGTIIALVKVFTIQVVALIMDSFDIMKISSSYFNHFIGNATFSKNIILIFFDL